jgi:hypothetical protein
MMTDDLRTKLVIQMTHVWIVHRRIIEETDDHRTKYVQEVLFDLLWDDAKTTLQRREDVHAILVGKYLKQVQALLFRVCMQYDEALLEKTEEEIIDALSSTIWNQMYNRKDKVPEVYVTEIAK